MKKSKSRVAFECFNTVFLLFMAFISLYPILYVVFASLSDSNALMRWGGRMLWHPLGCNFDAYVKALKNPNIFSGYKNTIFVVSVGLLSSMLLSSLGAFFMSRRNVRFGRFITMMILFTMWFNGGLIPFYLAVRDIHLVGSRWSLIIPNVINTYNMIILRTAFASVPNELSESAYIDGASQFVVFSRIILPLSKATLAVVAMYYAVTYWNAWFGASIFLQGETGKWPLQLVLRQILIVNDTSSMTIGVSDANKESIGESIKYAVIVIATVPILCVYPFVQKHFVSGVMIGAVKG